MQGNIELAENESHHLPDATEHFEKERMVKIVRKDNQKILTRDLHKIAFLINVLSHIVLIVITVYMVYKSFDKDFRLFSLHPSLSTFGFFALMSEAILGFSNTNLLHKWTYKNIVFWHWLLQTIAGFSIIVGFIAIYIQNVEHNRAHFTSYHGLFGFISVIFTGIAMIGGIFTKYAVQLKKIIRPIYLKMSHAIFGAFSFIFGLIAIILGFYTRWIRNREQVSETMSAVMSLVVAFTGIYVLYKPTMNMISRIKSQISINY